MTMKKHKVAVCHFNHMQMVREENRASCKMGGLPGGNKLERFAVLVLDIRLRLPIIQVANATGGSQW
jgi:hypothetical protein